MDEHNTNDRGPLNPDSFPAPDARASYQGLQIYRYWLLLIAVYLFAWFGNYWNQAMNITIVVLGLGFMIFIHELGHFLVAKWCDVHIETFSIGFGPALPGCRWQRGETTYMIAAFPLGGYVKMVGENPDGDEAGDTDPRSFKNKTVGQRMAIISAGVIMNVIFGAVCFIVVFMTHGAERSPGVIGQVEAGSPAYERGARPGVLVEQIGAIKAPHFDDLMYEVLLSSKNEALPFVYRYPGQNVVATTVVPRRDEKDVRPIIGVTQAGSLNLVPKKYARDRKAPATPGSAAAQASPPFQFGDTIIGTSDPEMPDQVKPLPPDPRRPGSDQLDFFVFKDRLLRLADKEVTIRVRREDGSEADIKVAPEYHHRLGLRMYMDKVVAIRDQSPAQKATVVGGKLEAPAPGVRVDDTIDRVEVNRPGGGKLLWLPPKANPKEIPAGVTVQELDPVKLPFDMATWATAMAKSEKPNWTVLLTVRRINPNTHTTDPLELQMEWDNAWTFDQAVLLSPSSPMDLPGLGFAYRVQAIVAEVYADSPAAKAGMKPGDLVKAVRFYEMQEKEGAPPKAGTWIELENGNQWAYVFRGLQEAPYEVDLKVDREGNAVEITNLKAEEDKTWPWTLNARGIHLINEIRIQKADSLGEAVVMGLNRTKHDIVRLYMQLRSLATGRLSFKLIGGPIKIAETAYTVADYNIYAFLLLLGMLNINLAVINFLPIPLLDGGHMVFLIYEKLRGKPASERIRLGATYAGLLLIGSLMIFVIIMDITRLGSAR